MFFSERLDDALCQLVDASRVECLNGLRQASFLNEGEDPCPEGRGRDGGL